MQPKGFWHLVTVLGSNRRILFGIPLLFSLLTGWVLSLTEPLYTGTARLLPPPYNENTVSGMLNQMGGESALGNSALTLKNPTDLYVGILSSRSIANEVIRTHKLVERYEVDTLDDTRRILAKRAKFSIGKDGIITIEVLDSSPDMAAALANSYVDELYRFSRLLAQREAKRRDEFRQAILEEVEARLRNADETLHEVEKRTGYSRLRGQDEAVVAAVNELQQEIVTREVQLQTLLGFATEAHPDVVLLRREIQSLKQKRDQLQRGRPARIGQGAAAGGRADQADGQRRATEVPSFGTALDVLPEHVRKRRDVEYWESIALTVGKFHQLGKIDISRDLSLIQVLDRAEPPFYKTRPRRSIMMILVYMAGFVLTALGLLFRDWLLGIRTSDPELHAAVMKAAKAWSRTGIGRLITWIVAVHERTKGPQ